MNDMFLLYFLSPAGADGVCHFDAAGGMVNLAAASICSRLAAGAAVIHAASSVTPNAIDGLCLVRCRLADSAVFCDDICPLAGWRDPGAWCFSFSIIDRRHVADDIHQIDQFLRM